MNGDQLDISPNGKTLQIRDLGSNSDATLIASMKKVKPKSKQKIKNKERYENNKVVIKCECGVEVLKRNMKKHLNSKKHINCIIEQI